MSLTNLNVSNFIVGGMIGSLIGISYIGYKIYKNYKKAQYYKQIQNKILNICNICSPYYMAVTFENEPDLEFIRNSLHSEVIKENQELANINHICYMMAKMAIKKKNPFHIPVGPGNFVNLPPPPPVFNDYELYNSIVASEKVKPSNVNNNKDKKVQKVQKNKNNLASDDDSVQETIQVTI